MDVIIYNPKRYGGKPCPDINNFGWAGSQWQGLKANTMARYPDNIATEMLKRWGFLREIQPEDIAEVERKMSSPDFICEYCNQEFENMKALTAHKMGKHAISEELKEKMSKIPMAQGKMVGYGEKKTVLTPEQQEGIPDTSKGEVSGWYGPGVEDDAPGRSMTAVRSGTKGSF